MEPLAFGSQHLQDVLQTGQSPAALVGNPQGPLQVGTPQLLVLADNPLGQADSHQGPLRADNQPHLMAGNHRARGQADNRQPGDSPQHLGLVDTLQGPVLVGSPQHQQPVDTLRGLELADSRRGPGDNL